MKRSLWQTEEWGDFQKNLGRQVILVGTNQMILYPLPLGKQYGYIPRGHFFEDKEHQKSFFEELEHLSKKYDLVFIQMDSEKQIFVPEGYEVLESHSMQPETSLVLDLSLSEKDLLAQMKRKGRYNIGLAEKKGLRVKRAVKSEEREQFVSHFYKLLKQTTERDQFSGHKEAYYQEMLKSLPFSEIYVAYHDEKPIAAGIFCFLDDLAIYYYGASSNEDRQLMAPYLLQWEAIKEAKKRGCKRYDFLGIAPEGVTKDHPWAGITDFKKKFGGEIVNYPTAKTIVFQRAWYWSYKTLKHLRSWIKR